MQDENIVMVIFGTTNENEMRLLTRRSNHKFNIEFNFIICKHALNNNCSRIDYHFIQKFHQSN